MIRRAAAGLVVAALALPAVAGEDPPKEPKEAPAPAPDPAEPARLPEVLVTGSVSPKGVPRVPLDATGSRDVFGPEVLRTLTPTTINDLVQALPAISTRPYNGAEFSAPSFSIRGLPDDGLTEYTLVLIDGVPASPLPYGWTAFSFVPVTPERIHAMDLVRGGQAVRYSPNTVGGVLNLVTPPIPEEPIFRSLATVGSFGYRSDLFVVGGTDGEYGALLTFVAKSGDGYRDDGGFRIEDLSLKFRIDPGKGTWLQAGLSWYRDEHQSPGGLTPARYDRDRFANERPVNGFDGNRELLDVVAHRDLAGNAWLEAFGSFSRTARRLHALPEVGPAVSVEQWSDDSLTGILGLRGGARARALGLDHDLYGGIRMQSERIPHWRIVSVPFAPGPRTLLQDRTYGLYAFSAHVDDTVKPAESLTVTAGLRGEWIPTAHGNDDLGTVRHDDRYAALLPGVDASWALDDRWALYGNAHRSFRAPQVWGYDFTGTRQSLGFEDGTSCEAGLRAAGAGGFSGSASAWRVDFDDVATFDKGFYDNFGRIRAEGVDLVGSFDAAAACERLAGLRFRAAWTHQRSELREGPFRGRPTPYAWRNKATWGASFETPSRWTFSVDGAYVGKTVSDEAGSPEDPTGSVGPNRSTLFWNARVSRAFAVSKAGEVEVAVGVTNLLDQERFVHSRGGFFGGGRVPYAPRQAFLSVGVSLWF